MNRIRKTLQILVIMTLALSGLLLGMSQGDFEPFFMALSAAIIAWMVVDVRGWFSLPQWLANIIAVVVTAITVSSFFFTGDSIRQLLGVGKLLVYLQSILLFQKKSARVYWQVLVLSLLQIVVGAVFNLGFEGGVLFIVYLVFAGITMLFLQLYHQQELTDTRRLSVAGLPPATARAPGLISVSSANDDFLKRKVLRRMARHFLVMAGGVLLFGISLFYFLPRENSSWSGPAEVAVKPTGYLQSVSMSHPDLIPLSSRLVMTVKYSSLQNGEPVMPREQPYLRGLALANLVIDNNETSWQPANSQVQPWDFRSLGISLRDNSQRLIQEIVIEPTDDPLVYSQVPARGIGSERDEEIEFCWPLGGLTRQRMADKIALAHYRYALAVPILADGRFSRVWPYEPRTGEEPLTDREDGVFKWLTYLDAKRYPTLVRVAGEVADRTGRDDHYRTALALQDYFSEANGFSYTVDFRNVKRDRSIDSVEDFFANHRSGHCSYYASALALMLRSLDIPSRVVVGFRGGVENGFGEHIDVEERHKHAWVEAYIPPDDCPEEWFSTGQAGRKYGAWLQLDATPAVDLNNLLTGDALNYARSFWRDYVLGLQADTGATVLDVDGLKLSGLFRALDLGWWQNNLAAMAAMTRRPGSWQNYLWRTSPLILLAGVAVCWYWYQRRKRLQPAADSLSRGAADRDSLRRRLGRWIHDAVDGLSPSLGRWLEQSAREAAEVPFYRTFAKTMAQGGWQRASGQTPMEFACSIGQSAHEPRSGEIGQLARRITEYYYGVRYGSRQLDPAQQAAIESALQQLAGLVSPANGAVSGRETRLSP